VITDSASVNTVVEGLIVRAQPQASLEDAVGVAEEEASAARRDPDRFRGSA
jgi:hypothetical protein